MVVIMSKYLVGAVVFLVLLGTNAVSLYKLAGLRSELDSTKSTLADVKAANDDLRAFTEDLQAQVLKAHIISASKRLKVQHVLSKNMDWSATPVPLDVANELCKQIQCNTPSKTN